MYIVAIAWLYVVLMMSIVEESAVAGAMTFLLYGVSPLMIILYVMGTPQRKRRRLEAEKMQRAQAQQAVQEAQSASEHQRNVGSD